MSEIKARLVTASEATVKAYDKWSGDQKNGASREGLQEAIHELRKVASRLEIELAISERDQNAAKPIAIPPHRAARGRSNGDGGADESLGNSAYDDEDDGAPGNGNGGQSSGGQKPALRRRLGNGPGGPRRPQE
ncbi:MAG TPA: hypothetical protein PLO23_08615 [Alphaproteobacteria bacterium]|nr:hypothetical protein [Alphaproteobacteria bacterium]